MNKKKCIDCGYDYMNLTCPCTWVHENLGGLYHLSSIDDIDENVIKYILDYMDRFVENRNLLFFGQSGTGKTHCATALAKYLANKYSTNDIAMIEPILISKLPSRFELQLKELSKVKILIIDELDNSMSPIVNLRLKNKDLFTICTTNLDKSQLDTRFSWRLMGLEFSTYIGNIEDIKSKKYIEYDKWLEYQENSSFGKVDLEDIFNDDGLDNLPLPHTLFTGMCDNTTHYYNETTWNNALKR